MKRNRMKEQLVKSVFLLSAGLTLSSCVDDSYDLSKDIDMTVQLGTEGLQIKLGNTERIHLASLLEIEDEEMIEQTRDSLYYLIEDGFTDFNFEVKDVSSNVDVAKLNPEVGIFQYDKQVPEENFGVKIPFKQGQVFTPNYSITAHHPFSFRQTDIDEQVVSIKSIVPDPNNCRFTVSLEMTSNPGCQQDFVFEDINNLKIFMPSFLKSKEAPNDIITINKQNIGKKSVVLGTYTLESFEMAGDKGLMVKTDSNGERHLEVTEEIKFEGDFSLKANSNFELGPGDIVNASVIIRINGDLTNDQQHTKISIKEVSGIFDPTIDPTIDPIDISKDLPDFLDDDEVVMDVANPTIKFNIDMNEIPTAVNFFSDLRSYKDNQLTANVRVPEEGVGALLPKQNNILYFFQGEKPFDPEAQTAGAQLFQVKSLSSLITKIPDEIRVDMTKGHIRLDQERLQTIQLSRDYHAAVDYTIYVPFQFNKGLKVVYKDSTDSFGSDLEDYMAEGAEVHATIISTVPLALKAKVIPVDRYGKEIPSIKVSEAQIPAAKNDGSECASDISLTVTLENPADLKKLDKMRFRVEAQGEQDNGQLCSNQYLEVKDMRIKLTGPVIADFN